MQDDMADSGFAIALTNDPAYWNPPTRDTIDRDFRIHDGRVLSGELQWAAGAGDGTKAGRDKKIIIEGNYSISWRRYSSERALGGPFWALLLPIGRPMQMERESG